MACIEVKNQGELDKALKKKSVIEGWDWIACVGSASFRVSGSSSVEARESSSVVARESSSVEAWGSSSVVARGSSSVVARGSSSVVARESSSVVASPLVAVHKHKSYYDKPKVNGGVIIEVPEVKTIEDWIAFNGIEVSRGWMTVYKAVGDEFKSGRGFEYPIGKKVKCDDFVGHSDCGNGLHFSRSPSHAKGYFSDATKFLACKVKVADAVLLGYDKVKAPACKVVCEVEQFMAKPIAATTSQTGDPGTGPKA